MPSYENFEISVFSKVVFLNSFLEVYENMTFYHVKVKHYSGSLSLSLYLPKNYFRFRSVEPCLLLTTTNYTGQKNAYSNQRDERTDYFFRLKSRNQTTHRLKKSGQEVMIWNKSLLFHVLCGRFQTPHVIVGAFLFRRCQG